MARHRQRTWLDKIDDRLHKVFDSPAAARPLESTQELCRSLLTDCTARPHRNSDGPLQCEPPRFIWYGWDAETPPHFDFVFTPGLPAFGIHFGPTEDDLRDEKGHYYAEAFERMIALVVMPPPLENLASELKESLVRYLSLRRHKPTLAAIQEAVEAEEQSAQLTLHLSRLQSELLKILKDFKPKTKGALAAAWGEGFPSDDTIRKAMRRFADNLLKHPEAGLHLKWGNGMYCLVKK